MDNTITQQQIEKVKITRGASGKMGYEISLFGQIELNIQRIKDLKVEFDKLIEFNNGKGGDE